MITNAGETTGKTITGGKSQENPAHPNELIAAFSAKHFLNKHLKIGLKIFIQQILDLKPLNTNLEVKGKTKRLFTL